MRHLDRTCIFALVLIVACHAAQPDAPPASDSAQGSSGTAGRGNAGEEGRAGQGAAGSAGQGAAGSAGQTEAGSGSTQTGGAPGHICQGAGGFPDADVVRGTNDSCQLLPDGGCAAQTPLACCPVKGAHYRWNAAKNCRSVLPVGGETATCALMDFAPAPGGLDPCSYTPAPSCFRHNGTNNVEIVLATDYWKPSQIGAGWEACTDDFQAMISDAADCP